VEKDLLQCVDCRQYLSGHLPSVFEDPVLHRKSTDRLRGLLMEAHEKTCSWRSHITSEDACAPNVSDYELASIDFSNRTRSLLEFFPVGNEKRYLIVETVLEPKVSETEISALMEAMKAPGFVGQEVSKDACIMALLGWRVDESCKECVCCDYCLRRIGLWIFGTKSSSETEGNPVGGVLETAQQRSPKTEKRLDPISQHHKWCPWVMAVSSSSALFVNPSDVGDSEMDSIPTWLALFRLLSNRGISADLDTSSLDKDNMAEHYVLARQLLEETLESIETSGQAELSVTSEENVTNITI